MSCDNEVRSMPGEGRCACGLLACAGATVVSAIAWVPYPFQREESGTARVITAMAGLPNHPSPGLGSRGWNAARVHDEGRRVTPPGDETPHGQTDPRGVMLRPQPALAEQRSGSPPPNNECDDARPMTDGVLPFDLAGATSKSPRDRCFRELQNDVWYDYRATCTGFMWIETCGVSSLSTPDTTLAVYDGCECPPAVGSALDCSAFACGDFCLGSRVRIDVIRGNCYKIRVGDNQGSRGSGDLTISCAPNDCNRNHILDECDIDCGTSGGFCDVPGCGGSDDHNGNFVPDECENNTDVKRVPDASESRTALQITLRPGLLYRGDCSGVSLTIWPENFTTAIYDLRVRTFADPEMTVQVSQTVQVPVPSDAGPHTMVFWVHTSGMTIPDGSTGGPLYVVVEADTVPYPAPLVKIGK